MNKIFSNVSVPFSLTLIIIIAIVFWLSNPYFFLRRPDISLQPQTFQIQTVPVTVSTQQREKIIQNNLFSPDRRPLASRLQNGKRLLSSNDFTLKGIAFSSAENAFAILQIKDQPHALQVRLFEKIQEWQVIELSRYKVVLQKQKEIITLNLKATSESYGRIITIKP
jgi:hypothetical protein